MFLNDIETIDELLEINAKRFGERTAYLYEEKSLSFSDLHLYSNSFSNELNKNGISGNVPVAIYMERCLEFILSIFSILKSGNAYLPLDCKDSSQRIVNILNDARVNCLITKKKYLKDIEPMIKKLDQSICVFILEDGKLTPISKNDTPATCNVCTYHNRDSVAYILYTSGTTGDPKGAAIRHKNLMVYIENTVRIFEFSEKTKIYSNKSFCFDASVTDIFCPFIVGGTMIFKEPIDVLPRKIINNIKKHKLTHISFTPVVLKVLIDTGMYNKNDFETIKTISVGGDNIQPKYINSFLEKVSHVRIFNRYGPTECTVVVSCYEINKPLDGKRIPIGLPFDRTSFYIIKDGLIITESNVHGELFIGGDQVMLGYWNNTSATQQALYRDIIENDILYKTGDIVYRQTDGQYVFIGRNNDIIKKNGYRINLNEIKQAALLYETVTDCVCLFSEHTQVITLIAQTDESPECIKRFLENELSHYLIPDIIYNIKEIPYTDRGKPDLTILKNMLER